LSTCSESEIGNLELSEKGKRFIEEVKKAGEQQNSLSGSELDEIGLKLGIKPDDMDAYLHLLEKMGLGLRVSSLRRTEKMLYLKPSNLIGDINVLVDPNGRHEEYRNACRQRAMDELQKYEDQVERIEKKALFRTRVKMVGSAAIITGYVGATGYLTACVYSWDTMEPLTYFFGACVNLVAIGYAGFRREEFNFTKQYENWKKSGLQSLGKKFDFERYEALKQYVERLK